MAKMSLLLSVVLAWTSTFIIRAHALATSILRWADKRLFRMMFESTDFDSTSTSTLTEVADCTTTAYTAPVIAIGPTSTYYSLTTYTSQVYDCHGCNNIVVIPYGHVFVEANFTTTVTAYNATTVTLARCSPTPGPVSLTTPS
ncbi:uncharacterized protein Z520_10477 [Fonsecaea multimorphosa CBS 102226]|uniref:Uncharacterized protein n=1 Tax=Fonsecaea multimorphosa CBS 102226 TaxID=1442371 RepID=A0A0D2JKS0_9EURO|nr:uncharacterized protein Z520_10477 [Fonsecaea multimorphosa CBS 102226]KIX93852.1 hypothetical protein Z520_10477 [Fonsecaea multimorphosa CBS 102226]OAL19091.1 hypothetical protein AYO22_10039 [Fonsecaea multimorphosa]